MSKRARPSNPRGGFSLAEALVSLVIAAVGLSMLFQLSAGSARLRSGLADHARTTEIAQARLAEARASLTEPTFLEGQSEDVSWSVEAILAAQDETGAQLMTLQVIAEGPGGQTVNLVSAMTVSPP